MSQPSEPSGPISDVRPLTAEERALTRWMLEHGEPGAEAYLEHLARAHVIARCPCGCASIDLAVAGEPEPSGGLHVLSDYVFGDGDTLSGAFVFARQGILAGVEVYGLAGDAPAVLPTPAMLRPFGAPPSEGSAPAQAEERAP